MSSRNAGWLAFAPALVIAVALGVLAVAALGPAAASAQEPLADPSAAFAAAQADLAAELGIAADEITLARPEPVTWTDGCLGLAAPGEACTLALVSGWALWLEAPDAVYRYHTDADGSMLRSAGAVDIAGAVADQPLPEGAEAREPGEGPGPAPAPAPAPTGNGGFLGGAGTPVLIVVLLVLAAGAAAAIAWWMVGRRRGVS